MNIFISILLSVVLSAQIDSTEMWLGNQTGLHLEATVTGSEKVTFPLYDTQIQDGIDIVDRSKIDTVVADGRTTYKQDYVVTSFKDSLFLIKPLAFLVDGDTQRTNSLSLNIIQPFEMDTTNAITDIKDVMRPKIWWWGIIRWILLGLLIAGLAVGGYFLYRWYVRRKQQKVEPVDPELLRPCDEVALEKLDKIKEEKAWQQGEFKKYYSDLTFVIREYIGRRYDVHSTEKTSDDTLAAMKPILQQSDQKELYRKLEQMLRLADLVKFAKWSPLPDETQTSLLEAYTFVRETRPEEQPTEAEEATKTTEN